MIRPRYFLDSIVAQWVSVSTFSHSLDPQRKRMMPTVTAQLISSAVEHCSHRPGEVGELMCKGPIVMQGYFGNEAATEETIEPDGWLHTGDLCKIDEDGYYYVVDRKKDMILTAGYNIYPAEIERVLAAHPAVAMSAVGRKLRGPVRGRSAQDQHGRNHALRAAHPGLVTFTGTWFLVRT